MAIQNYTQRLENLQARKFDRELNESLISKSFSSKDIPDNVKYMVESMRPIDSKYNEKTIEAAQRVQAHLEKGFDLHFKRAYRTQGSVRTRTNIKVHSDFDLLVIIDRYHYPQESDPNNTYTSSDPNEDIIELRKQAVKILKDIYDEVDDSGEKSISIFNKSLNRKVDIVFCFWYHSNKYNETNNEHFRGVYLYKFPTKTRLKDFPFATINNVNHKGDTTFDGSRRGIRLLKNLKADSDPKICLSSFHLTTIVHSIESVLINYSNGEELKIAQEISKELQKLIDSSTYRKSVTSPNGLENPLEDDSLLPELKKLKADLDSLIEDSAKEILSSATIKRAILTY
ncbi:MAG: hypothetical protein PSV16_04765 [Flavobacterium sp.]|nr:hypothetical protein [Flavobacterium sp.]